MLKARAIFQFNPALHQQGGNIAPAAHILPPVQALGTGGGMEGMGWGSAVDSALQRETAAVMNRLNGGGGSHLQAQAQALLLAQQQVQQKAQQQVQAQLLQQQQQAALLHFQRQGGLAGVDFGLSTPTYRSPALEAAPLPYNALMSMTLSALSDQLLSLSSSSQSSSLRGSSMGTVVGQRGLLSQLSSPMSSPSRPTPTMGLPTQHPTGLFQSVPSPSLYDMSMGGSFPSMGSNAQLLSDMPLSTPSGLSSSYPPAMMLAPSTSHQSHSPLSLMKPVARRIEDSFSNGGGMASSMPMPAMGGLSSLSLQQIRQLGIGEFSLRP